MNHPRTLDGAAASFPEGFLPPYRLAGTDPKAPVLVGYSGGADSTALLLCLLRLRDTCGTPVSAAHVNHGLRGEEAIRDREHCRAFCRAHDIPFYVLDTDVRAQKQPGESEETAARRIRYAFFETVMREHHIPLLALAHHADDQLETLLLRLGRGTGLRGLCGIPPVRPFGPGQLVRPLLESTREELLAYLGNEPYVTDRTNLEPDATRNRVRLEVIPALRTALGGVTGDPARATARTVRSLRADEAFLWQEAMRLASPDCMEGTRVTRLSRRQIAEAPDPLALRAILRLLEDGGADPSAVQLSAVLALCRSDSPRGRIAVPPGKCAAVDHGILSVQPDLRRKQRPVPEESSVPVLPVTPGVPLSGTVGEYAWEFVARLLPLPDPVPPLPPRGVEPNIYNLSIGLWLNSAIIEQGLFLRRKRPGDTVLSTGVRKNVRRLLAREHIPPAIRETLPLLCDTHGVVWIPFSVFRDGALPPPDSAGKQALFCSVRIFRNA